ncbi:hypothetical protein DFS34DRAFT_607235 [Phlyctochytrium arcticum]|nr:hypothetical protein DFS34DRAFT_607235 [Phlyctochytrium arcticum]
MAAHVTQVGTPQDSDTHRHTPLHTHAPASDIQVSSTRHAQTGHSSPFNKSRDRNLTKRRAKINRGGDLGVQTAHAMMACLGDAKRDVGGTTHAEIAYTLPEGENAVKVQELEHANTDGVNATTSEVNGDRTEHKEIDAKTATEQVRAAQTENVHPPLAPLQTLYGPFLNYVNVDLQKNRWYGNILLLHHASRPAPRVYLEPASGKARFIEPLVLDSDISATAYNALRFDLDIPLEELPAKLVDAASVGDPVAEHAEKTGLNDGHPQVSGGKSQKVTYTIDPDSNDKKSYEFYVAAKEEPWHWSFFSCNGFGTDCKQPEEDFDGVRPLWRDKLAIHAKRPLHLMVGCGDQIYQDDLFFHCQSLRQWLDIYDGFERESYEFTPDMQIEVERFYMMHYLAHFSQPVVSDAMAVIPSVNIVDDHDIFDGFGSYPEGLQMCPVFQAIGKIALRFFLLFQQHTTTALARSEGYWGGSDGYNFVKLMGPRTAIFGSDGRFERSKTQVCDPKTWDLLFDKYLADLPSTVEHLIFAAGVPVSFPVLGVTEKVMEFFSKIRRLSRIRKLFRFSGLYKKVGLAFGEPSNLDDLVDHWNSDFHIEERNNLIVRFQEFCAKRSIRVTIIAGDVHCAAVAQLRTQTKITKQSKHQYEVPPLQDPKLMYNIVSSAIGNIPPPVPVLKLFQWSSSRRPVRNVPNTTEGLVHIFQHDVTGKRNKKGHRKIMARRNWCEVDEVVPAAWIQRLETGDPATSRDMATPELAIFRLRFEPPKEKPEVGVGVYTVSIPRLVVGDKAAAHPELVKMAKEAKSVGVGDAEMDEKIADEDEVAVHNDSKHRSASPTHDQIPSPQQQAQRQHAPLQNDSNVAGSHPSLLSHPENDTVSSGVPRQHPNEWPVAPVLPVIDVHPFGLGDAEELVEVREKGNSPAAVL